MTIRALFQSFPTCKKAVCVLLAALRLSLWPLFSTKNYGSLLTKPSLFQKSSHSIKLLHNNTGFLRSHTWVVKGLPVFPIQAQMLNDTDSHWYRAAAWNKRMSLWNVLRKWKWTAAFSWCYSGKMEFWCGWGGVLHQVFLSLSCFPSSLVISSPSNKSLIFFSQHLL